jgi:hypothetical protein
MPSKIKPEWGKVAPGIGSEKLLSDDHALQLGALANVPHEKFDDFHQAVLTAASEFQRNKYYQDTETGLAAQRAALEELGNLASQLESRMLQLDPTTRQRIKDYYPPWPFAHELDSPPSSTRLQRGIEKGLLQDRGALLRRDTEHVRRFVTAVSSALAQLGEDEKAGGGRPDRLQSVKKAAVRFSVIWVYFTGEAYTTGAAYKGRSQAAAFVAAALGMLVPGISAENISTALRHAAAGPAREWRKQLRLRFWV